MLNLETPSRSLDPWTAPGCETQEIQQDLLLIARQRFEEVDNVAGLHLEYWEKCRVLGSNEGSVFGRLHSCHDPTCNDVPSPKPASESATFR